MPSYKVHLVGGVSSFALLLMLIQKIDRQIPFYCLGIFLVASLIGSLFPDIDVKSKMQHYFYLTMVGVIPLTIFLKAWHFFFIMAGICSTIPLLQHRTITHHIGFIVMIPGLIALILAHYYNFHFNITIGTYLFFAGGALSHIFLDRTQTKLKKLFSWR